MTISALILTKSICVKIFLHLGPSIQCTVNGMATLREVHIQLRSSRMKKTKKVRVCNKTLMKSGLIILSLEYLSLKRQL